MLAFLSCSVLSLLVSSTPRTLVVARARQPIATVEPPSPVVVFGPGSLDLRLIIAKLAARAGFATSVISGDGDERQLRRQMYGKDYAEGNTDDEGNAQCVAGVKAISAAIGEAKALCIVSDSGQPLSETALASAMNAATRLERVVLVSKIGVTRATAGPFGLGGGDAALREGEAQLRAAVAARDGCGLSIVRVGTLKGGGPGRVENGQVVSGVELGLSKVYYDSIFELETALVTQSYDKFTLGARCVPGDPYDAPNPVLRLAYKGTFDPRDDETSRVVACGAALAALRHPTAIELSVSAAKGEAPPTRGQWEAIFNSL